MKGDRVRIADIVRHTGLSRSTVDRVLNNRPGVQAETRKIVEDAIEALGYSSSTLDFLSKHRDRLVVALVPEGSNPFFEKIFEGFQRVAADMARFGLRVAFVRINPYDPTTLVDAINNLEESADLVIVASVDNAAVRHAIDTASARGIRVVTAISDTPESRRIAYVGQDNFAAGRTAARLMAGFLDGKPGSVAVLIGHLEFRHLLDRQSGFQQGIGLLCPDRRLIHTPPYGAETEDARRIVAKLLSETPDLKGIYVSGGGQPSVLDEISRHPRKLTVIGHELTPVTRRAMASDIYSAILCHDMDEVAQKSYSMALSDAPPATTRCCIRIYVADNMPADD